MCEVKIEVPETEKKSGIRLYLRTVFHTLCVCLCYFVVMYGGYLAFSISEELLKDPFVRDVQKFTPLFLTNWNFTFHTVFLTLSLVYDVLEWLDKHEAPIAKKIKYHRDILFCGLVVPMTCFVSSMFWIVYTIDRELVFPVVYDQIVPWWFNHCVHTNISIVILIETVLQARRHPTDRKVELFMNGAVGVAYAIVYYSIYFFTKRWLYAVFGTMTWWQVCLYQLLIWTSCFVFYFLQFPINRLFHAEESAAVDEKTEIPEKNGHVNEEEKNGHVEAGAKNGHLEAGDLDDTNVDFKMPPFSTKSWSLKYRTIRSQFENSRL